jgi:AbrB family looped-hinge helix DNA binding protein
LSESIQVKVSSRYQISVPSKARKELNIQRGDRLIVDVQDGMILLVPVPGDITEYLAGLHKDIWRGVDAVTYLREERGSWGRSESE